MYAQQNDLTALDSLGANYLAEHLSWELGADADDENQHWYASHAEHLYTWSEELYEAETREFIRRSDAAIAAWHAAVPS